MLTRCITVEAKLTDPKWGTHGFLKTADGVSLHYVEKGDRAKPMILFVHGFPEFWYQWHEQIEAFGADGKYHVVAFDMRGYNDSDKPEGVDNYSTEKLNEDVRQVILKLGPSSKKAYVVAHDWGGVVATAFAHQYPDNVDKLIIFNTAYGPAYLKTMITNPIQLAESLYVFLFQMTHIAEAVLYNNDSAVLNLLFDKIMPKKEVEIYKFGTTICFCIEFLNVFCFCFFAALQKPGAITASLNYYRYLFKSLQWGPASGKRVKVPTYLLWATGDIFLSKYVCEGFRPYWDNIEIKYVPGYSHWIGHENPAVITKFITDSIAAKT